MAKVTKKVDFKKVDKMEVSKKVMEALVALGISIEDGADFGFTAGTMVAHMPHADVQIKLITPKSGVERYEKLIEEVEEEETPSEELPQEGEGE